MFLMFNRWRYRRIGPLGVAFAAYRACKRLSPTQQEQIKQRARAVSSRLRARHTADAAKP
jgi:hypothetical protein